MNAPAARTVVHVDLGPTTPQRPTVATTGRIPRVAQLLALAHRIDGMVQNGEITDYAEAARRLGLTRARVTQISSLLLLAPAIQEAIIGMPLTTDERDSVTERRLRPIAAEPDWNRQLSMWRRINV